MSQPAGEPNDRSCTLDESLLALLACPVPQCRAALTAAPGLLVCTGCGLRYRCDGKWPTLIPEEALPPIQASAHEE